MAEGPAPPDLEERLRRVPSRNIEVEVRRTSKALYIARGTEHRELADVAAFIWRQANGRRSVDDIAEAVHAAYDVDLETARADVAYFVEELERDAFVSQGPG